MILSSLQNCVVSRLLIDSRPKGGHANQTGNCWIASGDSKTPPTFSSQGRVLTRGTTLVQPAVARRPSQPPTRLRSVTRPAVPPYFAVQADCSGASNPQRIPHRLAPTAGSLSGKGLSFSPSSHLLVEHFNGFPPACQEKISPGGKKNFKKQLLFPGNCAMIPVAFTRNTLKRRKR